MSSVGLRQRLCSALLAASLGGCAVTPPRWEPPAQAEVREHSMAYAKAYAHTARQAYQRAIDREVIGTTALGTGLIGLGGVIAALAAFGAHRDAILGTALLGGTAYGIGNWSLSKQRQLVYLAGVEAINCSISAVSAFDMPERDRLDLNTALGELEGRLGAVEQAIQGVNARKAGVTNRALLDSADQTVTEARSVSSASRDVLVGGRQIASKVYRAGGELVAAVDRIGAAVDKAALDTIPDLASVTKVVGGIAGFAGAFVPGSGVEARISQTLKDSFRTESREKRVKGESEAASDADKLLAQAIAVLASRVESLANATAQVRSRTVAFDPAATTAGLANCGVSASSAVTATPSSLEMKGQVDESYTVILAGGTKPYVVQVQGAAPKAGLTVKGPAPFDSAMLVMGNASLPKGESFSILVTDASNPPKSIDVPVTVSGTPAASGGAVTTPPQVAQPDVPPRIASLIARLEKVPPFAAAGVQNVKVGKPALAGNEVKVPIECEPAATSAVDDAAIRKALLEQKVAGSSIAADVTAAGNPAVTVALQSSCIPTAGARTESRSSRRAPVAASPEVRSIQRRLCLPAFAADGKWGPVSQAALNDWRVKTGGRASAAPLDAKERQRILEADAATAAKRCA